MSYLANTLTHAHVMECTAHVYHVKSDLNMSVGNTFECSGQHSTYSGRNTDILILIPNIPMSSLEVKLLRHYKEAFVEHEITAQCWGWEN